MDVLRIGARQTNINPTTEFFAGLVERVTFHNDQNGFCVLRVKARGKRDLITVVGHAATISAGEFIQAIVSVDVVPVAVGDTSRSTAAARKLPSLAMATTASSSINPLLYIVTILWIRHRSLSRLSSPLWCSHTQ
jgi:hypothetical protein